MSSQFPGSVLLLQEAVGVSRPQISITQPPQTKSLSLLVGYFSRMQHTVINQMGSDCYFGHVQAYLQGIVPPSNTTCPQQYTPFIDGAEEGFS